MSRTLIALAVLLAAAALAQPDVKAADCAKWGKERFWKRATVADVAACIDAGADPSARDKSRITPLHWAAKRSLSPEIIELLIAAGASPDARDKWNATPLHRAAQYSFNPAVVQALIAAGSRLEARTDARNTPLHAAARFNFNPEIVQTLVATGADIEARNQWGFTPLHRAASYNTNPEVIRALVDAGADPNALKQNGETPMDLTKKKADRRILAAAGGTGTRQSGGGGGLGALIAAATVAGVGASSGAETEDILVGVEAVASAQQTAAGGYPQPATRSAAGTAGGGSCEVPGYPRPPNAQSLGLGWCPASVDFQVRVFALTAAGAKCAIALGNSSTPDQVQARRQEIASSCERLAALDGRFGGGGQCLCPPSYPDGPGFAAAPAPKPTSSVERRRADDHQRRAEAERYEQEQIEKRSRAVMNSDCKCIRISDRTGEYLCMDGFVGENLCDINRGAGQ